ncbi:CPBP family intramembrane glutamic endopeptidase [Corynebacterium sp. H130]|uniref:CPBP family intramembrane glutamic endopeptidase n=1 Tax=Corynebacterium sp. H130 TaxID=3133444 RepID=UPI0030AFD96C
MSAQTLQELGVPSAPGPVLYLVAAIALVLVFRHSISGLKSGGWRIWGTILLGVAITFTFETIWYSLLDTIGVAPNSNTEAIRQQLLDNPIGMGIGAIVIGPVVEEMLYRFGIFRVLAKLNLIVGYLGTAVFFAFQHVAVGWIVGGDPQQLWYVPAFVVFSLVTCTLYRRAGSILAPILMHVASNAIGVAAMLA